MRYAAYASRASYKGILDKTRCTYDEMEFYARRGTRRDTTGERDSLTVSGLTARGKIRGFLGASRDTDAVYHRTRLL